MHLHTLVDQSYQKFLEYLDQTRVILLHPNSRYRSMLVAQLINTPELNTFYYAMGPDDIELQAFIGSITHDLANQVATFGRHINMLPRSVYANPLQNLDLVLDTFAADLAEMSAERFLLILDEYDRSDEADDVQRFIERLAGRVPAHCRLVLNGRTLPRLPWISMISQKLAILLEDDRLIETEFYGPTKPSDDPLEVYALGPGFVLNNGEPIDTWEGHLPRLLFFFALDRPVITRSEICQAFWPELDPDQAVNVFHVTKRRLHKALDNDVLVHDGGYYRVNPDMPIYYDAMEFAVALMEGRNNPDPARKFEAWQRAADLYRGPFLQGHNDWWIMERRLDFRAGYLEALTEMANVWLSRDRHEQALVLFQKALLEDNTREDLHQRIMGLYAQLGRRSEATAHYNKLVEDASKEGFQISEAIHRLYEEIMA